MYKVTESIIIDDIKVVNLITYKNLFLIHANSSITITNNSDYSIRLTRRHWFIIDSNSTNREVEGDGVVGEQPIIGTGESYQYVSGCNLDSEIGKMYGTYLMERLIDKKQFYVRIPEFQMIVPYKLN